MSIRANRKSDYPATFDACDRLDMSVMTDITQDKEDGPIYPVYYIGWPQELAAGIYGGSISPCFKTEAELDEWVKSEAGQKVIAREEAIE